MRNMKNTFTKITGGLFLILLSITNLAQTSVDLEQRFLNPSDEAKPWVYWFWMDGNVTKEGITADLEAMHQIGIGGTLIMGVGLATPPGNVDFNSPQWKDMISHVTKESNRLGMKMILHQCDGWATAGGPWMTPAQGIKEIVWTTKEVEGPFNDQIKLEQPKTTLGFYEDVAVVAVPAKGKPVIKPVKALIDNKNAPALIDEKPAIGVEVGKILEMQLESPQTIRTIVFHLPKFNYRLGRKMPVIIEASEDGKYFKKVANIDLHLDLGPDINKTVSASFSATLAKYIRINTESINKTEIGEIELRTEPMVDLWEVKAGFARQREHGGETPWMNAAPYPTEKIAAELVTSKNSVINISDKLGKDGVLSWTAPVGKWKIIRIGMTATGKNVAPRTNAGEGLEADKMSGDAIRFHFDSFAKKLITEHNKDGEKPIYSVHVDSWESGHHTWSTYFRQEFEKRCGYSMIPYLPVFATGMIVGSAEESERFLWDVRRTMADLIRDNFYKVMRDKCHENGVLFQSEAAGRQMFMYDPINYNSMTDISVGEFWMPDDVRVDCRVAASISHIYNRPIAAAESFTAGDGSLRTGPFEFKALGDKAFCTGINRFIIHRYCMQPWMNVEPGMSFGPYGINFERTNTWWKNGGKAWCEYITRCASLLQAGKFVGDVIYYIGDDAPNYLGHRNDIWNPIPAGYDYDGCNLEILKQLQVADNGDLVLPHGMRYKVLLLPNREHATLASIQEIERLVKAGATAIGKKPLRVPTLTDYPKSDATLKLVTDKLWGKIDGKMVTENNYGKGKMIYGESIGHVLNKMLPADFDYTVSKDNVAINYIHRQTNDTDFYFVANADKGNAVDVVARFRVTGKAPELWDASTGKITLPSTYRIVNGVTEVPIHFDPAGSTFVVFRKEGNMNSSWNGKLIAPNPAKPLLEIAGPWIISFPSGKQAPESIKMDKLISWTDYANDGVKYFSGTATYTSTFEWKDKGSKAERIGLDLGKVKNVAELKLNGKSLGTLWKPPFSIDVTDALVQGKNELEIKITNFWPNRLIGDEKLHPDKTYTYNKGRGTSGEGTVKTIPDWVKNGGKSPVGRTTFILYKFYDGTEKLLESGLLGPVQLTRME